MVEAYNYFIGGFLPKVPAKAAVHKKTELKKLYSSILSANASSPLAMVQLSDDKQAYALTVKELSMEMHATTGQALDTSASADERQEGIGSSVDVFNRLLKASDEFGEKNGKPSRPGGELRMLVEEHEAELTMAGIHIGEDSSLTIDDISQVAFPEKFIKGLHQKSLQMSINPLEYVDKKIYSYGFINRHNQGSAYNESFYSGMLFNSYC